MRWSFSTSESGYNEVGNCVTTNHSSPNAMGYSRRRCAVNQIAASSAARNSNPAQASRFRPLKVVRSVSTFKQRCYHRGRNRRLRAAPQPQQRTRT